MVQHLVQALLHGFTLLQYRWLNPLNLKDRPRRGNNSLLFMRTWQIYEQTGISKQESPVRVAHFLNVIGREGVQMFDTFTFDEASHESADNLDHVLVKYESRLSIQ